jgi:methionine--tRNA ligase beta chain
LDIRVGEIKEASFLEGSRNIIVLKVDLGEDYGLVEILSGIANDYKAEKLIGKKYAFLANLEPKKILGRYSCGMILASDVSGKAVISPIGKKVPNGTIIR